MSEFDLTQILAHIRFGMNELGGEYSITDEQAKQIGRAIMRQLTSLVKENGETAVENAVSPAPPVPEIDAIQLPGGSIQPLSEWPDNPEWVNLDTNVLSSSYSLAWSGCGKILVVAGSEFSDQPEIHWWRLGSGKPVKMPDLTPLGFNVSRAAVSPDGRLCAFTSSAVGEMLNYAVLDGTSFTVQPKPATLPDGSGWIGVDWSPDGDLLAICRSTGSLMFYERTGDAIAHSFTMTVPSGASSLVWSRDGRFLAGMAGSAIWILERTGFDTFVERFSTANVGIGSDNVCWMPGAKALLAINGNGGQVVPLYRNGSGFTVGATLAGLGTGFSAPNGSLHPTGRTLMMPTDTPVVHVSENDDGTLSMTASGQSTGGPAVGASQVYSFSPCGRYLAEFSSRDLNLAISIARPSVNGFLRVPSDYQS